MQRATARAMGSRPVTGRLVLALVLAGVIGGVAAAPARADDERGRDPHERLDRERAARDEWRDHRRRPVYVAAALVCLRAAAGGLRPAAALGHQPDLPAQHPITVR